MIGSAKNPAVKFRPTAMKRLAGTWNTNPFGDWLFRG